MQSSVSVIIPTYNRADLIGATVDSVLAQTVPVEELLVVDDGSTDATPDVIGSYGQPVRYIRIPHSGFASAPKNAGIEAARGEFVAFVDSDDLWSPCKLENELAAFADNSDTAMVYCDCDCVDDAGQTIPERKWPLPNEVVNGRLAATNEYWENAFLQLILGCFIPSPAPLIRRDVIREVGLFDTEMRLCEDRDYWMRVAYRRSVVRVPEVLCRYRIHGGNWTRNHPDIYVDNQKRLYARVRELIRHDDESQAFLKLAWRAIRLEWAKHYVTAAYSPNGYSANERVRMLLRALALDPGMCRDEPHVWKNAAKLLVHLPIPATRGDHV